MGFGFDYIRYLGVLVWTGRTRQGRALLHRLAGYHLASNTQNYIFETIYMSTVFHRAVNKSSGVSILRSPRNQGRGLRRRRSEGIASRLVLATDTHMDTMVECKSESEISRTHLRCLESH